MQICTICLPEKYLDAIQVLKDLGLYPSRSEAIRQALEGFLVEDLDFDTMLEDPLAFNELMEARVNQ